MNNYFDIINEAIRTNSVEDIKRIVEGYGVNYVDTDGNSPLLYLIKNKANFNLISYLIENDANVNFQDREGNTPLHLSVVIKSSSLWQYLIKHGADRLIKNNNNQYPFDLPEYEESEGKRMKFLESSSVISSFLPNPKDITSLYNLNRRTRSKRYEPINVLVTDKELSSFNPSQIRFFSGSSFHPNMINIEELKLDINGRTTSIDITSLSKLRSLIIKISDSNIENVIVRDQPNLEKMIINVSSESTVRNLILGNCSKLIDLQPLGITKVTYNSNLPLLTNISRSSQNLTDEMNSFQFESLKDFIISNSLLLEDITLPPSVKQILLIEVDGNHFDFIFDQQIEYISYSHCSNLNVIDAKSIEVMNSMVSFDDMINVNYMSLKNIDMDTFPRCNNLENFDIISSHININFFFLPRLMKLNIEDTDIIDLTSATNLTELSIIDVDQIIFNPIMILLNRLRISNSLETPIEVSLPRMNNMMELRLVGINLNDTTLRTMNNLKNLFLSRTNIISSEIQPNLTLLQLDDQSFSPENIELKFPKLERIILTRVSLIGYDSHDVLFFKLPNNVEIVSDDTYMSDIEYSIDDEDF